MQLRRSLPLLSEPPTRALVVLCLAVASCGGGGGSAQDTAADSAAGTTNPSTTQGAASPATPATGTPVATVAAAVTTTVNAALVPPADAGSPERLIRPTSAQPYRDAGGIGAFRTVCDYSHFNFDDALIYPGQVGKSHLHLYFGNSLTNAFSTTESVSTTGNGSCRGGIVNRSAYWVPAMIDTSTGGPVLPGSEAEGKGIDVYYKTGYHGVRDADVKPIPKGFRMIAGDSKSTRSQAGTPLIVEYGCNDSNKQGTIPSCRAGDWLYMHISFPQCWDGVNLDSPDHKSHVAYATNGKGCVNPRFPVPLPEVSYVLKYRVGSAGTGAWRLASDISGAPAGTSGHADYMFGWEDGVLESAVKNIINRGLSGGSDLVGDGRTIF
jgi:hypothetical protein